MSVTIDDLADWPDLRKQFDEAHHRAYGYSAADVEVQLLNLRLTIVYPIQRPRLPTMPRRTSASGAPACQTRKIYSSLSRDMQEFKIYQRDDLRPGDVIEGPAAVEEPGTTTIVDTGDTLSIEDHGCLMIHLSASGAMGGVGGSNAVLPPTSMERR